MPTIVNHLHKPLPHHIQYVLRHLFADYATVAVTQEIEQPTESGWLYQAQPASQDGEADRPCLAKVDRSERIAQEWQAYQDCIRHKLTPVAEIVGEPVYPPGSPYGGLRYALVGNGEEEIESLEEFYRRASAEEMQTLLRSRLFASLGYLWRQQKSQPACYLRRQYDSLLPVNLEIVVAAPTGNAHWLTPKTVDDPSPKVDDPVQVADFCVVDIDEAAQTLLLDLPGSPPGGYRLRVKGVTECAAYEIGRTFNAPLFGLVQFDRAGILLAAAQTVLGAEVELRGDTLPLADGDALPNPLAALDDILQQSRPLLLGFQHGDLRLANVLVARQSQTPYLTQFAQARRDHILGDLCCLEADVVTRLLPADMAPEQLRELYRQLHCAVNQPKQTTSPPGLEKQFALLQTIRQTAVSHLYKGDWAEYYSSLFVYLLRGLTAQELPLPAQRLAFWGAAVVAAIRRDPPICDLAAPLRGGVIGVTPPILLQPGEPVIQLGQHYCQWFLNRVQIAYHGVVWQQTPQVTVNSRVALHCPPLPDPAARAEAERPVQPGQTEQIGVNARLTDLTPAMMTNMSLAVDLVGAAARQTILSLVGNFQLLAGLRPGTYAILGTVDAARPLPDAEALKRLELRQGSLWLDDKPVTDYSYVLLQATAYGARTRVLARGAGWDEKLREAMALADDAGSGMLPETEKEEAWLRWRELLREARRLLAADPYYLPREADDIYKQAVASGRDQFRGQSAQRGLRGHQGDAGVPPDVLTDLTELGLDAEEDMAATLTRYAQQVAQTRRALRQTKES